MKLLALVLSVVACGTDPLPAGAACKQSAECAAGLMCLDLAQFAGSTCTVIGQACSKDCGSDADCASLGANFRCLASCSGPMTCAAVASP